jgi:hypothetical protein
MCYDEADKYQNKSKWTNLIARANFYCRNAGHISLLQDQAVQREGGLFITREQSIGAAVNIHHLQQGLGLTCTF